MRRTRPFTATALCFLAAALAPLGAEDLLAAHASYVFSTDLEPDDVQAQRQFFMHLKGLAQKGARVNRHVTFLVGEGAAPLKVARQKAYLDQFAAEGLLPEGLACQVLEGFGTHRGPQAGFDQEGLEVLGAADVAAARGRTPQSREAILRALAETLKAHPGSLVISIKPVREWLELARLDKNLLRDHVFAGSGSYNFRATFPRETPQPGASAAPDYGAAQEAVKGLLASFRTAYVYETHTTTRGNAVMAANAPTFFTAMMKAPAGHSLASFRALATHWGAHVLKFDREELPRLLASLKGTGLVSEDDLKPIAEQALVRPFSDLTEQGRTALYGALDKVTHAVGVTDREVNRVKRIVTKWKGLTEGGLQFLNMDPGLIAALSGSCDDSVQAVPVRLDFKGDYTLYEEAPQEGCRLLAFIPAGLSVKEAQLPDPALDEARQAKFKRVRQAVNAEVELTAR